MLRQNIFARQKQLGVIPDNAEITARPSVIPAWDDMADELKPVLARQMGIYAGFLEQTDHEIGRVVEAIADLGALEDTLLYHDGNPVGSGRVDMTIPMAFSGDEACDVGRDTGSPASPDYGPSGNAFTGTINWVQIDIGDDNHDHLISPQHRIIVAMGKQ